MIEGYVSSLVAGQVATLLGRCGLGEVVERLQFYQVSVLNVFIFIIYHSSSSKLWCV